MLTAAQHYMGMGVAPGVDHADLACRTYAEKAMGTDGGLQGIYRDIQRAIGAILETYRTTQARSHFPVGLRFGSARADCGPGNQILQVLRRYRVKGLGGYGQPESGNIQEQLPCDVQALTDAESVVEMRVVDQSLSAHRAARFLEVSAHDQI